MVPVGREYLVAQTLTVTGDNDGIQRRSEHPRCESKTEKSSGLRMERSTRQGCTTTARATPLSPRSLAVTPTRGPSSPFSPAYPDRRWGGEKRTKPPLADQSFFPHQRGNPHGGGDHATPQESRPESRSGSSSKSSLSMSVMETEAGSETEYGCEGKILVANEDARRTNLLWTFEEMNAHFDQ
jgi:hypothetical protein